MNAGEKSVYIEVKNNTVEIESLQYYSHETLMAFDPLKCGWHKQRSAMSMNSSPYFKGPANNFSINDTN